MLTATAVLAAAVLRGESQVRLAASDGSDVVGEGDDHPMAAVPGDDGGGETDLALTRAGASDCSGLVGDDADDAAEEMDATGEDDADDGSSGSEGGLFGGQLQVSEADVPHRRLHRHLE